MGGLLGHPAISSLVYMVGCIIFMRGYFPTPRNIYTGDSSNNESTAFNGPSPKLVWMVIDALRADFTADSGAVPFLDKMREMGHVRSYVALAEPPTVTLPRVKALTTGAVPEFLDVLRNYGGGALAQDSLVRRLHRAGRRVVFYGDDTWLRLFPDAFVRSEGTHSFFVNDYTEVDDNVTRHLPSELSRSDWDVLILHYLGLDHIGHLAGPTSPLISRKLREMSGVMETIYRGLGKLHTDGPPPVLVVCGDHGMSEAGSHGGASAPETQVALHFISPLYAGHRQTEPGAHVRQLDLAPTLSALPGVPAPAQSVGRLLEDAVKPLGRRRLATALISNGRQLLRLYRDQATGSDADVEAELLSQAERMLSTTGSPEDSEAGAERAAVAASGSVQRIQAKLLAGAAQHDAMAMTLGSLLLLMTLAASCAAAGPVSAVTLSASVLGCSAALLLLCGLWPGGRMCAADGAPSALLFVIATALAVAQFCSAAGRLRSRAEITWPRLSQLDDLLLAGCGLHIISLGASSFIEEEHQTWYFLTTTLWLVLFVSDLRRCRHRRRQDDRCAARARLSGALVLSCGLLRRWNQTGDKWLHVPDFGDWLTEEDHRLWLAVVWAAGLLVLTRLLATDDSSGNGDGNSTRGGGSGSGVWAVTGALCLLLRGLADERLAGSARLPSDVDLWSARAVFVLVLWMALGPSRGGTAGGDGGRLPQLRRAWLLLCALLVRPHNLPVWTVCVLQSRALLAWLDAAPGSTAVTAALMAHWTGMAGFFYMGNSNSLASVDISAGYVGQTGHNSAAAVLLTACHTYAAPVLALLTALLYGQRHSCFSAVLHTLVTVRGLVLLVYCCLSAAFLRHIFVWTVFSPKLLYEAAWTAVMAAVAVGTSVAARRSGASRRER